MKRLLTLILVLGFPVSLGAAGLTQQGVDAANTAAGQLRQDAEALQSFTQQVDGLVHANWIVNVAPGYTVTVDTMTQANILTTYTSMKAQLVTDFNNLP